MKKIPIIFLQGVIFIIAVVALYILIRMPLTEGRAQNLDLVSIYSDPFILYGYASSIVLFIGLYKAFNLLGYIRQDKLFSQNSIKVVRSMRYCAIIFSILIVMAGIYIMVFHHKDDDPAGFLSMCVVITFITIAVAIALVVLEKILQKAVDLKSENDLTI